MGDLVTASPIDWPCFIYFDPPFMRCFMVTRFENGPMWSAHVRACLSEGLCPQCAHILRPPAMRVRDRPAGDCVNEACAAAPCRWMGLGGPGWDVGEIPVGERT